MPNGSATLSWCFEDERTPAAKALLERAGEAGAVAPQHWPLEVLNGLMLAERRQRADAGKRRQLADFLSDRPRMGPLRVAAMVGNPDF